MKNFVLCAITVVMALSNQHIYAQCSATLTNGGKGCVGDTLKISVSSALQLQWYRGTRLLKTISNSGPSGYGVTVAGQTNGSTGTDSTHLNSPVSVIQDASGNLYVSEFYNHRVTKWAPGAKYGVTVAGQSSCNAGSDSMHLNNPYFICLDSVGNLYIADNGNNRVQKWAPGAKYGVTVAGSKYGYTSTDSLHLYQPVGLFLDSKGNLYISEDNHHRVMKWAAGTHYGVTVAGQKNCSPGNDSMHLGHPYGIWVDASGNLYVCDRGNNRVQKWAPGAKYGTTVAGQKNTVAGNDSVHLNNPVGAYTDGAGNLYVDDGNNSRVQLYTPGSKYGITVAGQKNGSVGSDSLSLHGGGGIFTDNSGALYIADFANNRIQKWANYGSANNTYTIIADSAGTYSAAVTFAGGCSTNTNAIIVKAAAASTSNISICMGQAYIFNGNSYTATGTYTTKFSNVGCDSIVTLNLTVKAPTSISLNASVCAGSGYNFNGRSLTLAGTYSDTLKGSNGCDSIVVLSLSANGRYNDSINAFICAGGTYRFNGNVLTSAGTYIDTLVSSQGCDSITALNLMEYGPSGSSFNASVCTGKSYNFNGRSLTKAGSYSDTLTNYNSCDSVVTLNLTVNASTNSSFSAATCSGTPYNFNGKLLTVAGDYIDTLTNGMGCDSVVRVFLSINGSSSRSTIASTCSYIPYFYDGKLLSNAGTYTDTFKNSKGCDSTVSLTLTVYGITSSSMSASTCAGLSFDFHGKFFTTAGTYIDTITNFRGCDSIVTIHLTVNAQTKGIVDAATCAGTPFYFHGKSFFTTGTYYDTLINANGCDSIVTIHLIQNTASASTVSVSTCTGIPLNFYGKSLTATGTYMDTMTNKNGCDSIAILHLLVNAVSTHTVYASTCSGTAYSFNGKSYTSAGMYADTLTNIKGCDSFLIIDLTVNNQTTNTLAAAICTGSAFNYYGKSFTNSGTYLDTITNVSGCDSVVTIHLTVSAQPVITINASICQGGSYAFRGKTYNSTGSYIDTLTAGSGCDSIVTINLTVNKSSTDSLNVSTCAGMSYNLHGKIYTASGTYIDTLTNNKGCDSIITLSIVFNSQSSTTLNISTFSNQPFRFHGKICRTTGTYTDTLKNSNGCDSIVTLNLNVVTQTSLSTFANVFKLSVKSTGYHSISDSITPPSSWGKFIFSAGSQSIGNKAEPGSISAYTLGISQMLLGVYPNPNSGQFTISIESANYVDKIMIQIFDLLGKEVEQRIVDNTRSTSQIVINNPNLAAGLYVVKATQGTATRSSRVMIER